MSEKLGKCPDCGAEMRACNMARHRRTHIPIGEDRGEYTKLLAPKRPIRQYRTHDHRYDEAFPRGEGPFRFRIYRLRGGELQIVGAAPTPQGFGLALYCFNREGEYIADDATGVLDTLPEPGDWVVHPFALGRRRED